MTKAQKKILYRIDHNSTSKNRNDISRVSNILKNRFKYTCSCCGIQVESNRAIVIHHAIPLEYGGTNGYKNLVPICAICHALEHDKIEKMNINEKCDYLYNRAVNLGFSNSAIKRIVVS